MARRWPKITAKISKVSEGLRETYLVARHRERRVIPERKEVKSMQDQYGNHFETPDGKAPSTYGQNISVYTPAGLVPGQWLGSNGAQKL
jgi:hypothetical protein